MTSSNWPETKDGELHCHFSKKSQLNYYGYSWRYFITQHARQPLLVECQSRVHPLLH